MEVGSEICNEIEKKLVTIVEKLSSNEDFDLNYTDENGYTLLHFSSHMRMKKLCQILLENGANVNATDIFGRTSCMIACHFGFCNIVEQLLACNATTNQHDTYGFSGTMHCIYPGNLTLFKQLFMKQDNFDKENQSNYLSMSHFALACFLGKFEIADYILSQNPENLEVPVTKSGMTPLMLSICAGHEDIVDYLKNKGANIHATSSGKWTPYNYAQRLSFPLLKLGVPVLTITGDEDEHPNKGKVPPLTPNAYISPLKKISSPKDCLNWIRMTMKRKRSRSLDSRKNEGNNDKEKYCTLQSVFQIAKMEHYWPLFKREEVNFKIFLKMNKEDLCEIGITETSSIMELLNLIDHYNKIFYL